MKLWAISDVHVRYRENQQVVEELPAHPDDWLILGGDVGEKLDELGAVIDLLRPRYRQLVWVPGNHELWTMNEADLRGEAKYRALVEVCRARGVLTPEDPYATFEADVGSGGGSGGQRYLICPLFTLYDYSFCPPGLDPTAAKAWAREEGLRCADESVLHPDPYPTREAWCAARCELTEARLAEAVARHQLPTVLIDHFPLRAELARLPMIPRFSIWCGTRRTEEWHRRFRAAAVVFGHLHIPQQKVIDGVPFDEVSLGYPRQWRWRFRRDPLRQILPR